MESKKKSRHNPIELMLNDTILPNVETATHLGIQCSKTDKETIKKYAILSMIWASVGSVQFNVILSAQAVAPHSMYPIFMPNLDCCSCFNNESMLVCKIIESIMKNRQRPKWDQQ
jgi:hypothetical protein